MCGLTHCIAMWENVDRYHVVYNCTYMRSRVEAYETSGVVRAFDEAEDASRPHRIVDENDRIRMAGASRPRKIWHGFSGFVVRWDFFRGFWPLLDSWP